MNMPKPIADLVVSASRNTSENTCGSRSANVMMTMSAADQIEADLERRQLFRRAADRLDAADDDRPRQHRDDDADDPSVGRCRTTLLTRHRDARFGCVNGVVVSAATPATSAYVQASAGDFSPSRR